MQPNRSYDIQPSQTGATLFTRKLFQTCSVGILLFSRTGICGTQGAISPLWISVSVSLAFDKWNGKRWRRKENVLKQKWEGGWKRGILWLDVMHASVYVHCVVQVSGFYLSEGRHWGMHTSGQMRILRPRCKSYHVLQSTCVCFWHRQRETLCVFVAVHCAFKEKKKEFSDGISSFTHPFFFCSFCLLYYIWRHKLSKPRLCQSLPNMIEHEQSLIVYASNICPNCLHTVPYEIHQGCKEQLFSLCLR